jgi:hypothetical protein
MVPQEKKMELCEQCGSFLVTNDVLERTQSHVTGKQHIGYGLVRDFLDEYKVRNVRTAIFVFMTSSGSDGCLGCIFRLQGKRRGLRGRRKRRSVRTRGREDTIMVADATNRGRDPGCKIVISTVSGTVTERGAMSMEVEGQTIEAVRTTGGITKGRGTEMVGMVIQEETQGE